MDLPLAYKKVISPGSRSRSRHFTVSLCIIPSCSWTAISSRQGHLGYKQKSYIFVVLMAVVTLIQFTRWCLWRIGGFLPSAWVTSYLPDQNWSRRSEAMVGSWPGFLHILVCSFPLLAAHNPKKSRALFQSQTPQRRHYEWIWAPKNIT